MVKIAHKDVKMVSKSEKLFFLKVRLALIATLLLNSYIIYSASGKTIILLTFSQSTCYFNWNHLLTTCTLKHKSVVIICLSMITTYGFTLKSDLLSQFILFTFSIYFIYLFNLFFHVLDLFDLLSKLIF